MIKIIENHNTIDISTGLGVQLTKQNSEITRVTPLASRKENKILIRHHSLLGNDKAIVEKSYEEALFILFNAKEPNQKELQKLQKKIRQTYMIKSKVTKSLLDIKALVKKPLIFLQLLILSLAYDENMSNIEIIARAFVVVAELFNRYSGRASVSPDPDLSLVENLLYMIGKNHKDKKIVKNFSRMMIGWIDVGLAPSAVAVRVNASSRADVISAVTAGIGNATGAKHTSARIASMKLLEELRSILVQNDLQFPLGSSFKQQRAKEIIRGCLQYKVSNNETIPGFGHYIFKGLENNSIDPRIYLVEKAINDLYPNSEMLYIVNVMRELFREGSLSKNNSAFTLPPNSDIYWSAFLYYFLEDYGAPEKISEIASLFTILTRISGMLAHDTEQRTEPSSMKAWGWIAS